MSDTNTVLVETSGVGTQDTLLTASSTLKTVLLKLLLCNQSTTTAGTFSLWIIPTGQSLGDEYLIINAQPFNAKDTIDYEVLIKAGLNLSDVVKVETSIANVNIRMTYAEE